MLILTLSQILFLTDSFSLLRCDPERGCLAIDLQPLSAEEDDSSHTQVSPLGRTSSNDHQH